MDWQQLWIDAVAWAALQIVRPRKSHITGQGLVIQWETKVWRGKETRLGVVSAITGNQVKSFNHFNEVGSLALAYLIDNYTDELKLLCQGYAWGYERGWQR